MRCAEHSLSPPPEFPRWRKSLASRRSSGMLCGALSARGKMKRRMLHITLQLRRRYPHFRDAYWYCASRLVSEGEQRGLATFFLGTSFAEKSLPHHVTSSHPLPPPTILTRSPPQTRLCRPRARAACPRVEAPAPGPAEMVRGGAGHVSPEDQPSQRKAPARHRRLPRNIQRVHADLRSSHRWCAGSKR